ncbi:hypothetical protein ACLI4Y_19560 [Natrialbaceae archaeon A-CW3]
MTNVFLAPCDSPNFDDTVKSTVDLNEYSNHPDALNGREEVRFWGARTGARNEGNFEKMQSGDLVLFYQDGNYVGTAWVESKFEDEEGWASTTFWRGGESNLVYTLTEFKSIAIPREKVNAIFDYTDGYYPQGLMRVSDDNVEKRPASIKLALERYSERHN